MHTTIHGLKPEEDSFGNNIFESYNSGNLYSGHEIEERSDGRFILNGDSNSYFEPFEEWTSIQKQIAPTLTGRILDVGCGGGAVSPGVSGDSQYEVWGGGVSVWVRGGSGGVGAAEGSETGNE